MPFRPYGAGTHFGPWHAARWIREAIVLKKGIARVSAQSETSKAVHRSRVLLLLALWRGDAIRTIKVFWRENGLGMAGTIAFFGFLSLVPLVILVLAFLGDILVGRVSPH